MEPEGERVNGLVADVVAWFSGPERWSVANPSGIPFRIIEHLHVSTAAIVIAIVIAVPPAMALAHRRRAEALASAVVNIGRAVPSFGLIVLFWLLATRTGWVGTRFWPLVGALVALALPPIFTNTYTAIRQVDPATVEAARGMGLRESQVLWTIELPLASSVVVAGIRLAYVQVVATTAIGAIVTNGGGVGRFIVDGFATGRAGWPAVVAGAIVLGALTLAVEGIMALVQRKAIPAGVRAESSLAVAASRGGAAG